MLPSGQPHWVPQPPPPPSKNVAMELVGNGFNARLSDAISLDRNITDNRHPMCRKKTFDLHALPKASVVIVSARADADAYTCDALQVFHQEYLSVLLRSVHSILNRYVYSVQQSTHYLIGPCSTPPEILHEIVLVDDASTHEWLKGPLDQHVSLLPKVKIVRLPRRSGLVVARLRGIEEATAEVFVVLDSHIEVQPQWLEPLLYRIAQDRRVVVMPMIDSIEQETFAQLNGGIGCTLGFLWSLVEHGIDVQQKDKNSRRDEIDYTSSPTMVRATCDVVIH